MNRVDRAEIPAPSSTEQHQQLRRLGGCLAERMDSLTVPGLGTLGMFKRYSGYRVLRPGSSPRYKTHAGVPGCWSSSGRLPVVILPLYLFPFT